MPSDAWIVLAAVLGGGVFVVLIPVLARRSRRSRRPAADESSVVAPFMIDGDGGDGGGD